MFAYVITDKIQNVLYGNSYKENYKSNNCIPIYINMHTYCSLQTVLTVSVNFLLLESACLSKEDSCNTVSYKEITLLLQ